MGSVNGARASVTRGEAAVKVRSRNGASARRRADADLHNPEERTSASGSVHEEGRAATYLNRMKLTTGSGRLKGRLKSDGFVICDKNRRGERKRK